MLCRSRLFWMVLLGLYAAGLFALSSLSFDKLPASLAMGRLDQLVHAAEFALFYLLARRAIGRTGTALLLTIVYAGSDEFHQIFVPARTASFADFGCDLLGAFAAAFIRNQLLTNGRRLILALRASGKERGT